LLRQEAGNPDGALAAAEAKGMLLGTCVVIPLNPAAIWPTPRPPRFHKTPVGSSVAQCRQIVAGWDNSKHANRKST